MPSLRDVLAFVIGAAGIMSDFYGALDLHLGHVPLGVTLLVAGVGAVWAAFRVAGRG